MYLAESHKIKPYVEKYLVGRGLDIGCGAKKIVPHAIGIDFENQYDLPEYPSDADFKMGWEQFFSEHLDQYDYIFSAHLLEDYPNPFEILAQWMEFIKPNGLLILQLPIEDMYRKIGSSCNCRHVNNWKGALDFYEQIPDDMKKRLEIIDYSFGVVVDYSFYIVMRLI
jgi:SAM-dependent methyltransferase